MRSSENDALAVLDTAAARPGSRSSTPRTCTATAAASGSSASSWPATPARTFMVATKMGRRVEQDPENLHAGQLPGLDRPVPGQPRRGPARPGAAALPAHPGVRQRRGLRRARHAGRRAAHRGVRGERGDLRPGAHRDRAARHRHRADHPQRVPAQAAGRGAARGARGGRRHHRPRAARVGPAVRPVHPRDVLRGRRPPHTTTGTARPSTSARRSPAWTTRPAWTRPGSSPPWPRRAPPPPRPRCAG